MDCDAQGKHLNNNLIAYEIRITEKKRAGGTVIPPAINFRHPKDGGVLFKIQFHQTKHYNL